MFVRERAARQKILIAVDFGTTFSSVIWQQTNGTGGQHLIQNWPDENSTDQDFNGENQDIVPTVLAAGPNGYRWGHQIENEEERYEWFKLGLDPSSQMEKSSLSQKYPNKSHLPLWSTSHVAASPQYLSTTYLGLLLKHVERMLTRNLVSSALEKTPREYIITVPAVWSEKARELTATCAVDAGMGSKERLHMVSEPEAAAIYAFSNFKETNQGFLGIGDTFVLCDAGGGTVDLISYTIKALEPILELEEAAPGSGEACGSTFLNRIFAKAMNDRFKGHSTWESDPDVLKAAMERFEKRTKNGYNGLKGDQIPMPEMRSGAGIKKQSLELSCGEIEAIFEPVIQRVLSLIHGQIRATEKEIKLVILVGGFSKNDYLGKRIKADLGTGVEVKVSQHCQTAVVRGALMKGLAETKGLTTRLPRVRACMARKHYGTYCVMDYVERQNSGDGGHSPERRKFDPLRNKCVVDIMKWFLNKGDTIDDEYVPTFGFTVDRSTALGKPQSFSIDIYCHDDPDEKGAPKYKTQDVVKLATVTADIRDLDPEHFKRDKCPDGTWRYVLDFAIEMKCLPAKLTFTPILELEKGHIRCKPASVKYE